MPLFYRNQSNQSNQTAHLQDRSICFDLPDRSYRERYIIRSGSRKMKGELLRKLADALPESVETVSPPWQISAVSVGDTLITLPTDPRGKVIDVKPTDIELSLTDLISRKKLTMLCGEIDRINGEKIELENMNALLCDVFFCLESTVFRLRSGTFLSEKAERFANRFAAALRAPIGDGRIKCETCYATCAGGIICSGKYTSKSARIYAISDKHGANELLLETMEKVFISRGVDLIRCTDQRGRRLGIYIESAATFIGKTDSTVEVNKVVNTDRFVSDNTPQNKHFIKKMLRAREEIGAFYEENQARIEKFECEIDMIFESILDRSAFNAFCERIAKEIVSSNAGKCDK